MKGYVSLALLLSFAFCAETVPRVKQKKWKTLDHEPTVLSAVQMDQKDHLSPKDPMTPMVKIQQIAVNVTTQAPNTTQAPSITTVNATTQAPNTTQAPSTTTVNTTDQAPNTTQAPSTTTVNTTAQAPNTTQAPSITTVNTTTQAPNTTQPPSITTVNTTDQAPNTTQAPSTTTVNTTDQAPNTTQAPSITTGNNSSPAPPTTTKLPVTTAPPTTTEAPLPCANKPCRGSAKCINLYQGHTCQCPYGYYYIASRCQEGKVFPGEFALKILYTNSMANENSLEYWDLYRNVTDFFNTTFTNGTGYGETIIVTVKQSLAKSRIQAKAETGGTNVVVRNMFEMTTDLNATQVASLISGAMKANPYFNASSYVELNPCAIYGCDETTTDCKDTDVVTCECKLGFSKKNPEDKSCSDCDNTCSAEKHMHCVVGTNSAPVCQCLPNFRIKDGNCVACDMGYSGVNCRNNSLLILIIVAVLCGVLILGLIAGLIFTSLRAKKRQKNPERRHLLREDDLNKSETREPVSAINLAANGKIFPKIQTGNGGLENRGFGISNPYDMEPQTRKLPETDYDEEEYEMSSKGDGFRLQRKF